jgi:signal transduction histidine kinase
VGPIVLVDPGPATAASPAVEWLELANRNALVATLFAGAVHETSNALQVISGSAEMLTTETSEAARLRRCGAIVDHALAATASLQQIKEFARHAEPPAAPASLRGVAVAALALRRYSLRKARIQAEVGGDDGECLAPARALLQVVLNLVVNAEQALAGGAGDRITLTVSAEADAVQLAVADNGPGFPAEARARTFSWPPVSHADRGTQGIGLLVSRGIVEHAGGSLAIADVPGGGAAVTIRLPRPASGG